MWFMRSASAPNSSRLGTLIRPPKLPVATWSRKPCASRTGRIRDQEITKPPSKASELFHKLVWKLLGEYRHARRIHIILDNYIIHSSKRTKSFLAQFGDRVVLPFLPPYCPDDNQIERVWLDLHANVTRNHRCRTMEELMVQVLAFMRAYNQRKKLNPSLKLAAGVSGSRSVV